MTSQPAEFSRRSFKWIKAQSGTTYLCPVEALAGRSGLPEEEMRAVCVNESLSPHND